jgi:hypothetical protein
MKLTMNRPLPARRWQPLRLPQACLAAPRCGRRRRAGGMMATDRRTTGTQVEDEHRAARGQPQPEWHAGRAWPIST